MEELLHKNQQSEEEEKKKDESLDKEQNIAFPAIKWYSTHNCVLTK